MKLNRLAVLQSLFVSGLVVANIIAAKVVVIWGLVVPAAIIIYPFTFLLTDIIGEYASRIGLKQFRCAETQKYNHVTYFFNCRKADPFPNEDWVLVESPKVKTFDLKPEMSAYEVTEAVLPHIKAGKHDLMVVNYANPDMVGHTGVLSAAVAAMETVDTCVGRVVEALQAAGGCALITADHGNCEQMTDPAGAPHTAHTTNIVPLILVDSAAANLEPGILADIAPSLLDLMALPVPADMTGHSLIQRAPFSG